MEEDIYKIRVDNNFKESAGDANKLGVSIENVTTSTNENSQAVDNNNESYRTFKTQLREANQELQKQIQLTGESSIETINAAKQVAKLRDQMEFASAISDQFNPDQKMKALGAATQIAGTGLQGVTSGMALFGDQSKDTQEQLLKVQAAMAFSDAISNLSNLGDQWQLLKATIASSTIAQKANTAATGAAAIVQKLFTGSVDSSSKGFKNLKLAIAGTGIGLLVVGLTAIVTNFDKVKSVMSNIGWLKKLGDTIKGVTNAVTDFLGLSSDASRVLDKQKEVAEKSLKQNESYLKRNEHKLSEARKREIELSNEHFQRIIDGEISKEESLRILREKAQIDRLKSKEKAEKKEKKEKKEVDNNSGIIGDNARQEYEELQKIISEAKKRNEDSEKTENELKVQTENERFEAEKQRLIDAKLSIIEIETEHKRKLLELEDEYFATEYEKAKKRDSEQKEIDEQKAKDKIDTEKNIQDSVASISQSGASVIESLEALGLQKSKASQGIKKGLVLTQIASDSAIAISKAIPMALEAGKEAAAIAGPAAPIVGPLVTAASLAGSFALVAKNVSTAKQILGASGGGVSIGNAGGAAPQSPPTVAFNNTAENQIGQSISRSQSEQAPIKVVVSESDITDAQNNVKVLVDKNKI